MAICNGTEMKGKNDTNCARISKMKQLGMQKFPALFRYFNDNMGDFIVEMYVELFSGGLCEIHC